MKLSSTLFPSALVLVVACGAGQPPRGESPSPSAPPEVAKVPAPSASEAPTQNADDAPTTTPWGDSFTAPKGWWVQAQSDRAHLEAPEKDLSVYLLALQGKDASAVADKAWAQVAPAFARKVATTSRPPASDGWDEIVQFHYEVPSAEARTVIALLQRAGATWHVVLLDGSNAALGRRGAQVAQLVESLKAPGVVAESFAGRKAHALAGERLASFDAFVESARTAMGIPGMAVAVVQGGKIVFEKGYGVRALGQPAAVTPHTRFMIGSTTKSLTTLMMARRIDAGAYSWETPVTTLLPSFALGDAEATKKLLLRHTVCACTGMPRQDFEFFFQSPSVSPEARIAGMARMKPTTGFGEVFQYSNALVGMGGYVAARGYGGRQNLAEAYDLAMRKEVFEPLGMRETTLDVKSVLRAEHAMPSSMDGEGKPVPIRLSDEAFVDSVKPAGAVWSTAHDMAAYAAMELAKGLGPDGKRYVSEANLLKRRERQVKITDDLGYGLGLFVGTQHGVQRFGHGGNNLGFTSEFMFLPDQDAALVLLFNGRMAHREVFERKLWELLFDGKPEAQADMENVLSRRKNELERTQKQRVLKPGAAWFKTFAGRYHNEELGGLTLQVHGDAASFRSDGWQGEAAKKVASDGAVSLVSVTPPFGDLEFVPGQKDGRRTLTFTGDEQHPYVFTEVTK